MKKNKFSLLLHYFAKIVYTRKEDFGSNECPQQNFMIKTVKIKDAVKIVLI